MCHVAINRRRIILDNFETEVLAETLLKPKPASQGLENRRPALRRQQRFSSYPRFELRA